LESYKDIFSQERKQVAIILQPDFPGWSLEQIESALEKFEKYDLDKSGILDRDEFYQLKEEILGPKFSKLLLRYATDDVLKKGTSKQFYSYHIIVFNINTADKDNTGALSEQEFLDAFSDIFSAKVDNTAKVSVSSTAAVSFYSLINVLPSCYCFLCLFVTSIYFNLFMF
jgi:small-conductance mechanosensitive channel